MGLTSFKGAVARKEDINISKNYLYESEIIMTSRLYYNERELGFINEIELQEIVKFIKLFID